MAKKNKINLSVHFLTLFSFQHFSINVISNKKRNKKYEKRNKRQNDATLKETDERKKTKNFKNVTKNSKPATFPRF